MNNVCDGIGPEKNIVLLAAKSAVIRSYMYLALARQQALDPVKLVENQVEAPSSPLTKNFPNCYVVYRYEFVAILVESIYRGYCYSPQPETSVLKVYMSNVLFR